MTNDLVGNFLTVFIAENEGQEIDLTGAYGPQSPDLIAAYISALIGRHWAFPYPYASDLWEDAAGSMTPEFERIQRNEPLQRGDVVVFEPQGSPYGTVGIIVAPIKGYDGRLIDVFTQNPGPARVMPMLTHEILGGWRLTAGAERVKEFDEYAKRVDPFFTWSPGDGAECGHTEVVTPKQARHYRRQTRRQQVRSFLARLADSVRGRK
jgi:hypothetical protein